MMDSCSVRPVINRNSSTLSKLPESYTRYLMNGLRKDFDLWGVPIRFNLRGGKNPFEKRKKI